MSHYSRNHLQENWDAMDVAYRTERVDSAEAQAGRYFDDATKTQKAAYTASIGSLLGMVGPKWNRAREAARSLWTASTEEARRLFDQTVEQLLETGEITDELSEAWTALERRDEVRRAA